MELKGFHIAKETITRVKNPSTEWEKTFAYSSSDRGLISRMYKELRILNTKRTNNPMDKWKNILDS
jgi:hypothetical protein